jgi:membrane fusion protein (multidrug efflux system)
MSKKRKVTFILVGVFVALVALALPKTGWFSGSTQLDNVPGAARDRLLQVRWHLVQPGMRGDRIATVGTILSNEEVEIRSEVPGKVEQIFFREGTHVRKGDPLLSINDAELQAQFLRAQANRVLAEQQKDRLRQLYEKNLASQAEYDNAVANWDMIRAEAQLIKAQLDKTKIRAPFSGRIGLRNVSEGSYLTPAALITTLQDNSSVKIDFSVPEKYAGSITPGDKMGFGVQGTTGTFAGTVYAVQPKIDQGTRTLRVRARAPNGSGALVPGALATVDISLKEQEALMIPSYALIPDLKGHRVFVYRGGVAEPRPVTIGSRTEESVQVMDGLQSGDTVITSAILQLRPGMAVQLVRSTSPGGSTDLLEGKDR